MENMKTLAICIDELDSTIARDGKTKCKLYKLETLHECYEYG